MRKPLTVDVPHQLGKTEARRRITAKLGSSTVPVSEPVAGTPLTLERYWQGDCLLFRGGALGQSVSGRLEVFEEHVRVEVELPLLLAGIARTLSERLGREGQKLLGSGGSSGSG